MRIPYFQSWNSLKVERWKKEIPKSSLNFQNRLRYTTSSWGLNEEKTNPRCCPSLNMITMLNMLCHVKLQFVQYIVTYSPSTLTCAGHYCSERSLPAWATFKVGLASESYWMEPMLVLDIHWWPAPVSVDGLLVTVSFLMDTFFFYSIQSKHCDSWSITCSFLVNIHDIVELCFIFIMVCPTLHTSQIPFWISFSHHMFLAMISLRVDLHMDQKPWPWNPKGLFIHLHFLWSPMSFGSSGVNMDHLQLHNQSHNLYIMSQGLSSYSVKWPLLIVPWMESVKDDLVASSQFSGVP